MIRKNIKLLIGFVIGLAITTGGVYAVNSLSAGSITIDKSNMSKVETNTLQSALDYLYSQSGKNNMITIESGVKHLSQTYLGIAYLDPTDLSIKCTAANSVSTTGTKTGCMKWYIYKDLGDSYKMILDHNTTAQQAWNTVSDDIHPYGTNVEFKKNNGNLAYDELMKLESVSGWKITPDLIEADEVAGIVGKTDFDSNNINNNFYFDSKGTTAVSGQGTSNYAWVYDNLGWSNDSCTKYGCNINDTTNGVGYWTKTPVGAAGDGSRVWNIRYDGYLSGGVSINALGLRPVITISKSLFN